jgi:carboxypeptidase C (cathepsin A)
MIFAIFAFYDKFPEYKDQDLYLTGEQYAGVIIPMMAKAIIEKNNDR